MKLSNLFQRRPFSVTTFKFHIERHSSGRCLTISPEHRYHTFTRKWSTKEENMIALWRCSLRDAIKKVDSQYHVTLMGHPTP